MNDIDNTNKNCGAAEVFGELTFEQAASKLEEIVENWIPEKHLSARR